VLRFWREFCLTEDWKYPELPPSELLSFLNLPETVKDLSEGTRAEWFWKRRPRFTFCESIISFICYVTVGACLLYGVPGTIDLVLLWIAAGLIAALADFWRFKRWRSEYESSIDRLLQSYYHTKPGKSL